MTYQDRVFSAGEKYSSLLTKPSEEYVTRLWNEIYNLHVRLCDYKDVYGTQKFLHIMQRVSAQYFKYQQVYAFYNIALGVARLMDREKIRGDFNLSLKKLPDLLIDKNVAEEVRKQIESLDNSDDLKGIRSWRHKKGAHNDYVSIVTEVDLSLKQQAVSECLGKICKIMSAAFVQDDIFGNVTPDRTGLKSHRHMFALLEYGLDKIQQESDEAKTALVAKNSDLAAFMNGYFYSMLPSRDSHEK